MDIFLDVHLGKVFLSRMTLTKLVLSLLFSLTTGRVVNFEDEGALPDDFANEVAWSNGRLMNQTLASLMPGMLQIQDGPFCIIKFNQYF